MAAISSGARSRLALRAALTPVLAESDAIPGRSPSHGSPGQSREAMFDAAFLAKELSSFCVIPDKG